MKWLSTTKNLFVILFMVTFSLYGMVYAGPPIPFHTVEGNSGAFITSTAYLANPPEEVEGEELTGKTDRKDTQEGRIGTTDRNDG